MTSPCGKIRIPINESADDKSQIVGISRGLQRRRHPAYRARHRRHPRHGGDAEVDRGMKPLWTPRRKTYYAMHRPSVCRTMARIVDAVAAERGILIDGAPTPRMAACLLQIFTRTVIVPDLLRDHPAQGRRGLRRGQLPRAVRVDRAGPDQARRAEGRRLTDANGSPGGAPGGRRRPARPVSRVRAPRAIRAIRAPRGPRRPPPRPRPPASAAPP